MRTITIQSFANSSLPTSIIVDRFHQSDVADAIEWAQQTIGFAAALALLSIDNSDVDAAIDAIQA